MPTPSAEVEGKESVNHEKSRIPDHVQNPADANFRPPHIADDKVGFFALLELRRSYDPLQDVAVAGARAGSQPRLQDPSWGADQHNGDAAVALPGGTDHRPGNIADDRSSAPDIVIDRRSNAIAVAVGVPPEGKPAVRDHSIERLGTDGVVTLRPRGRAGHHASGKHHARIVRAGRTRAVYQRILAGAARTDHQNEAPGADHGTPHSGECASIDEPAHATRLPRRHTARTIGTSRTTRTRIRSARLPSAISPRSSKPTAWA